MKLYFEPSDCAPNPQQQEERKAPAEFRFVGSEKKNKGHILFSYNTVTGEWKQAEIKREVMVGVNGLPVFKTIAVREKDCIYVQAMNLKNAIKKLKQTKQ